MTDQERLHEVRRQHTMPEIEALARRVPIAVEQFARIPDPVRDAALGHAVRAYLFIRADDRDDSLTEVLEIADRFAVWLAGGDDR